MKDKKHTHDMYSKTLMLICLTFLILCLASRASGINSTVTAANEKAYFISQILTKHPRLADQIWNIGFTAMLSGFGRGGNSTDQAAKKMLFNYVLDTIPDLLKNKNFKNMVHDLTGEIESAYKKSKMAEGSVATEIKPDSFDNGEIIQIIKHMDFGQILQDIVVNGKPLIDAIRGKDSTALVSILGNVIEVFPSIWKSQSFQAVKDVVIEELKLGYESFLMKGSMVTKDQSSNSTTLLISILKHTNVQRLISRALMAGKPIIDDIRGKDSTDLLLEMGLLAKLYPVVTHNQMFQSLKEIGMKHFGKTFHDLNYTKLDFQKNTSNVIKNVVKKTNKIEFLQEVLAGKSARDVFRMPKDTRVKDLCYSDTMDSLDSVVNLMPWSIKMLDSTGKLSGGILNGHLNMVGSYDECLDIKAQIPAGMVLGNQTKMESRSFRTRYCRVSFKIPTNLVKIDTRGMQIAMTWGTCVPESCYSSDVEGMIKSVSKHVPFLGDVSVYCSEEQSITDDSSALAAIVVLSIVGIIVLLGSMVEIFVSQRAKWRKSWNVEDTSSTETKSDETESCNGNGSFNGNVTAIEKLQQNIECYQTSEDKEKEVPVGYMPHAEEHFQIPKGLQNTEVYHQTEITPENKKENSSQRKDGIVIRIMTAFAVQTNTRKILSGKRAENSITCIHGIRFLSLCWILLGHTLNYGFMSVTNIWTADNVFEASHWIERFSFQVLLSAPLAVDSFFMISGLLVVYIQIKHVRKLTKDFKCIKVAGFISNYIFHRVWRLTPLYMIVLMIFTCLMKYFGDGPFWPSEIPSAEPCKTYWWTNLLYVNNFLSHDKQCMTWSWFLSNDMQFYIIALIFLGFLALSIPVGIVSICVLMGAGIFAAGYSEHVYKGDLLNVKADANSYWDHVYIPPWCRVSAYCVGMLLGLIFAQRPRNKLNWIVTSIGWLAAASIGMFLVYIPYSEHKEDGTEWSVDVRSVYESLGRPLWATCVAWVIFACHNGSGGIVNSLLSWRGLVPFSKLSYAGYLIHPIIMMTYVYSRRSLMYLSDYNIIYLFIGHFMFTFMGSFVMSLIFEAPFMKLEKIIMRR